MCNKAHGNGIHILTIGKILNSTVDILFDRKGIDEKWMETDVLNFYLMHFREKRCGSFFCLSANFCDI